MTDDQDHERHRVLGVDYPGVVPRQGKSVRGTLVQNLTRADAARLDAFEGDVSPLRLELTEGIRTEGCEGRYDGWKRDDTRSNVYLDCFRR
jgi:hypothetical protein